MNIIKLTTMLSKKTIKRIYNAVIILLLLCGIIYISIRFCHFGRIEYTDDARVERHIHPVNTRVQGFISEIRFDDYQKVHKGDTLVVIDNTEYLYQLAQAQADLAKARSGKSADAASLRTTANNVTVAEAGIEEAKANLDNAKEDYERYRKLIGKDAVTQQEFDAVETRYKAAQARYDQMSRQRRSTELVGSELSGRLGQSEAGVMLAEAALELARLRLSYTVITAPCDGYVGRKDIHPGQLVQPGQLLVRVVDESKVWVVADYRETQLKNIHEGSEVIIKADAVPGVKYKGHVESIASATGSAWMGTPLNNATGNFVKVEQRVPVRIVIDEEAGKLAALKAGLNVETEVRY